MTHTTFRSRMLGAWLVAAIAAFSVACTAAPSAPAKPAAGAAPTAAPAAKAAAPAAASGEKVKVGFLYVGPRDDFGYNYAADQGRMAMEKKLPNVETIFAENVPENAEAERVMEQMIRQGAKIIFPTSFGHLAPALKVAPSHPDVIFLHQGGDKTLPNVGTYFGEIWQPVYASGVAAGKVTKSGKLGYIVAHPIPQVLLNVNAFHLGARSVNPNVTTTVVFTADWCNPAKNTEAANSLMDQGVDVLSQHQDCTVPVIQAAERRGAYSVGYHADAGSVAPNGWITGSMWTWGDLYADMVQQILDKKWTPSVYRAGLKDKVVNLAPFGPSVAPDVQKLAMDTKTGVLEGKVFPFKGPIKDQAGTVRIAGDQPGTAVLESMDWLAEGVIGTIPR